MPDMNQMRLWYFGNSNRITQKKAKHKNYIVKEIAAWDVIIKLALRYTKGVATKSNRRWSDAEICKFVFNVIWSEYNRVGKFTNKQGNEFQAPTFWSFAAENRHSIQPHINKTASKSISAVFQLAAKASLKS